MEADEGEVEDLEQLLLKDRQHHLNRTLQHCCNISSNYTAISFLSL